MSRNVKYLSQSVKRAGAFRDKHAVEMLMHRRLAPDVPIPAHRSVHCGQLPAIGFKPISIIFAGISDMPWNATSRGEVFVIDDDATMRETLSNALQPAGYDVICFADGAALLSSAKTRVPACVFLEVRVPDKSGLEILKKLRADNCAAPIFVTSANGDIPTAVEAIRHGAFDFIEKPLSSADLIVRVCAAIGKSGRSAIEDALAQMPLDFPGLELFTRREREVLARIAVGDTNKQVARKLGLSVRTVEGYRASILEKAGVKSAVELLRSILGQSRIT